MTSSKSAARNSRYPLGNTDALKTFILVECPFTEPHHTVREGDTLQTLTEGKWITLPTDFMRAYFDLCIIKYFLNVISPNNDMQSKLTWLFIRFPEIDLKALGFPQGWETEPLWR